MNIKQKAREMFDEKFKDDRNGKNSIGMLYIDAPENKLKSFIDQIIDMAVEEERRRIWSAFCDLAEPDERQFGAGYLNTHLDVVHKIINIPTKTDKQ